MGGKKGKIGGEEKRWGGGGGSKEGDEGGGEVVGQTREKEGKRRGEGGSGGNGGEGGEGEGHASVLWNITIQTHHTVLPYKITIQ